MKMTRKIIQSAREKLPTPEYKGFAQYFDANVTMAMRVVTVTFVIKFYVTADGERAPYWVCNNKEEVESLIMQAYVLEYKPTGVTDDY